MSQGFYTNPLFSDETWSRRELIDNDKYPVFDNEEDSDISVPHSGLENKNDETHH
jgi:hypothetical protein